MPVSSVRKHGSPGHCRGRRAGRSRRTNPALAQMLPAHARVGIEGGRRGSAIMLPHRGLHAQHLRRPDRERGLAPAGRRDAAGRRHSARGSRGRARAWPARGRGLHGLRLPLPGARGPRAGPGSGRALRPASRMASPRARLARAPRAGWDRLAPYVRRRARHDLRPRPLRRPRPRGRRLRTARPGLASPRRKPARATGVARRRLRARDRGRDATGAPLRREPAAREAALDPTRRDEPRPRGPAHERGLPTGAPGRPLPLQLRLPGRQPGLGASGARPLRPPPRRRGRGRPRRAPAILSARPRLRRAGLLPRTPCRPERSRRRRGRQPLPRLRRVRALARGSSCPCSPTGR